MNTPRSCVRCGARSWLVTTATGAVVCTSCWNYDDEVLELAAILGARRRLNYGTDREPKDQG